jgi:hypothetical protein
MEAVGPREVTVLTPVLAWGVADGMSEESHVTRHTSYVIRHTSHATRQNQPLNLTLGAGRPVAAVNNDDNTCSTSSIQ